MVLVVEMGSVVVDHLKLQVLLENVEIETLVLEVNTILEVDTVFEAVMENCNVIVQL